VDLAKAMSVPAVRVEQPSEVEAAIRQALAHPGPFLIDVVLAGDTHPERIGNTCGQ
jgi:benzoylformate decarboxylase